jgi:hypothetical protein
LALADLGNGRIIHNLVASAHMLTLFTIPKALSGHAGVIQDNAIASWSRLSSGCETILFGDDPGVAGAAARHGARHVPEIERNAAGTPILSDVFARAEALARHKMLCFVNCDIILFRDILAAVAKLSGDFLMVASRFNCRITDPLAFDPDWDVELRRKALSEARMYPAGGSDTFVYRSGLFGTIPPFAIGRGYWDNWLMLRARERGARLIDVTPSVVTVHQDHDYAHIPGVPSEVHGDLLDHATEEIDRNLALAGGHGRLYTVYDATEVLMSDGRLVRTIRPTLIRRRIKAIVRRALTKIRSSGGSGRQSVRVSL